MKMLTTAAALAAVLVSAGTAMASPNPSTTTSVPPRLENRSQWHSNENLRIARRHVERAIDSLQRDAEDYGGHRVIAINDLIAARADLRQALEFVHARNVGMAGGAGEGGERSNEFERNQVASNESIQDVRAHVESAIDALNRDKSDYGGFKERAIDKLQAARAQLEAALDFVHNRRVDNGGSGQGVSNGNLAFVQDHIQAAVSTLERDRHDYGGHRIAAINDLNAASADITSALQFQRTHAGAPPIAVPPVIVGRPITVPVMPGTRPVAGTVGPQVTQGASNESLVDVRAHIEKAIDALSRDAHDYGGYRVKAIGALRAARSELLQALESRERP